MLFAYRRSTLAMASCQRTWSLRSFAREKESLLLARQRRPFETWESKGDGCCDFYTNFACASLVLIQTQSSLKCNPFCITGADYQWFSNFCDPSRFLALENSHTLYPSNIVVTPQTSINVSDNAWTIASKQAALKRIFNVGHLSTIRAMWP